MESDALPYVLFLVLAELALGASMVKLAVDLRGNATVGFVRATTLMVPPVMGLALWLALELDGVSVNGYRLDTGPRDAIAALLAVATGLSALYPALLYAKRPRAGRVAAGCLAALAVVVLVLLAMMLRLPAWNFGLVFVSLLAGTLTLGLAAVGLSLGHWYLVTPRLPAKPRNLRVQVGGSGIRGRRDRERRLAAQRVTRRIHAAVEHGDQFDQAFRLHVPDTGRVGIAAQRRRVARQRDHRANPLHVPTQQIRLERHQVPVARGEVNDRLHTRPALYLRRKRQRAHPHRRHRIIAHIDAIHAGFAQGFGGSDPILGCKPVGRI